MMKLEEIYHRIVSLKDYKPSPEVNSLFSALVGKAVDPFSHKMLSKKKCGCLQKVCSHAEYELEKFWAKKIIRKNKNLRDFPYYYNYKDLTRLEWNALASCSDHKYHQVLFVGSGPLPMTALMLALNHKVSSTLLDNDTEAVELSRKVIRVLGLEKMIRVIKADGESFKDYQNFNVIFVAALAGKNTKQKESIFKHISKKSTAHSHIIARSSWGKRNLLYPPLPKSVYFLFRPVMEISPYNEIVNSVVILKK